MKSFRHRILLLVLMAAGFSGRSQNIYNVAGQAANPGFSGDSGPATAAQLNFPEGIDADASGNVFIADRQNNRIRRVDASGIITTIAGTGTAGFGGDGGPATSALLNGPTDVQADAAGNIYVVDAGNYRVRKIDAGGTITTIAGDGVNGTGQPGVGDGGPATAAQLSEPWGIELDGVGNIYIGGVARVRKVDAGGVITTIAGNGTIGSSGDGGPATAAAIGLIKRLTIDAAGNLYLPDFYGHVVRMVSATGIITTLAGNGTAGYTGDGGPATAAMLNTPDGLAVDTNGNRYISDFDNAVVRRVDAAGTITTFAGIGLQAPNYMLGAVPDGTPAADASLSNLSAVIAAPDGMLYISDFGKGLILKTGLPTAAPVTVADTVSVSCAADHYAFDVLGNDTAPAAATLDTASIRFIDPTNPADSVTNYSIQGQGTFTINYAGTPAGYVTFIPAGGYQGASSIQYVVKDSYGNVSNAATISIDLSGLLSITGTAVSQAGCSGSAEGSITVNASGGAAPYQYAYDNNAYGTQNVFDSLAAGDHLISVKDGSGCIAADTVTLTSAPEITLSAAVAPINCYNGSDGMVSLTAGGGAGSYTYSQNSGAYGASAAFSGLAAGNYTFSVKDANGCTKDTFLHLSNPQDIIISNFSGTYPTCNGSTSGSIDVSGVQGGAGSYTYALDNSAYGYSTAFTGLGAGAYVLHVKDANGCIKDQGISLQEPPAEGIGAMVTNPVCTGSGGSITLSGSGGAGNYEYALDSGAYAAASAFNSVPAGSHTAYVKDGNGCIKDTVLAVSGTSAVYAAAIVSGIVCNGGNDGSVMLGATGGSAPFTYALDNGAFNTQNVFSSLPAGDYIFHVKDSNGCVADTAISLTQPAALTIAASVNQVSCYGAATGSVTLSGVGGTSAYVYAADSGAFTAENNFTALGAGTHAFHLRDANGCTKDTSIIIAQPQRLTPGVSITNVSCAGGSDGVVSIQASGGTAPYEYAFGGSSLYGSQNSFAGLPAGLYTLHVRDANSCVADSTVAVGQPTAVQLSATATALSCHGGANGSVQLSATGGTPGYTYAKDAGAYGASASFGSLAAGSYLFHIKDTRGCVKDTAITVSEPAPVQPAAAVSAVSCFGGNDGLVQLSAAGGTPGYTYAKGGSPYNSTGSFGNLPAGAYTFHVKDANGCIRDTLIAVAQPVQLTATATVSAIVCWGEANGAITLNAAGGTPPYFFAIDNGLFDANGSFGGLPAGTYQLHLKDANNCTKDTTVMLGQPARIRPGIALSNLHCYEGADGQITVSATGGLPAYTYSADGQNFAPSNHFANLGAGIYTLYVRDYYGCTRDTAVLLTQPSRVVPAATLADVLCNGANSGAVTLSAAGGTPGYTYAADGGPYSASGAITALPAGSYLLHVRDAHGCIADTVVTLTEPPAIAAQVTATDASCYGLANGSLDIAASGGVPGYTYALNNSSYSPASFYGSLGAGNYSIHIKDANGCLFTVSQALSQPSAIVAALEITGPACQGFTNGSVTVNVSGGTPGYAYALNGGGFTTGNFFSGLGAGTYSLSIQDAAGCTADTTFVINEPAALSISTTTTPALCSSSSDGTAMATASGGTSPYGYQWSSGQNTALATGLAAGTYLVSVTDGNGCNTSGIAQVGAPAPLDAVAAFTTPTCNGQCNGTINLSPFGGTPTYTYAWNDGATTKNRNALCAGNYEVTITDAHSCPYTRQFQLAAPDALTVYAGEDRALCLNQAITQTAVSSDTAVSYRWGGTVPGFSKNTAAVSISKAGTYWVKVTNSAGCTATDTVVITESGIALQAEFVSATQAFVDSPFTMVNISTPMPDQVQWIYPTNPTVSVLSETPEVAVLQFSDTGSYYVTMIARLGGCAQEQTNKVIVVHADPGADPGPIRNVLIEDVMVAPNPSHGRFTVTIDLAAASDVKLRLISVQRGEIIDMREATGADAYTLTYDLNLSSGQYILLLEAGNENRIIKLTLQ